MFISEKLRFRKEAEADSEVEKITD